MSHLKPDHNKYPFKMEKLPQDHPHACPRDHECFEWPFYYDYQDTYSNWHYDKWTDPSDSSNAVHRNLQFVGDSVDNLINEVQPYVREHGKAGYINDVRFASTVGWYSKMEIRDINHGGYKEQVKPEKHPTLTKIIDWFEFESNVQPSILQKMPGNWEIFHVDTHCGNQAGFRQEKLLRVLVAITPWEFGQIAMWGTQHVIQWKPGEVFWWDPDVPHAVFNSSRHIRYNLRLTGTPSKATFEKLSAGGQINVDEL